MREAIRDKVLSGARLAGEDAVELFRSEDLFTIGRLASHVAEKHNGTYAYFVANRHINPTNICINRCKFCAFSRSKGEEGAFELTVDEMLAKLKNGAHKKARGASCGFSEVHIVGGLHPEWPFEHYLTMISAVRRSYPSIGIKAFTAVEIDYMSKISGAEEQGNLGNLFTEHYPVSLYVLEIIKHESAYGNGFQIVDAG